MDGVEGALLCMALLAAAALAVRSAGRLDAACILIGGALMAVALGAAIPAAPSPGFTGLWLAGCTAWALRPVNGPGLAIAAGSCAALAGVSGVSYGISPAVGVPLAMAVPLIAGWLARTRPGFAPAAALDESLTGLTLLALALAGTRTVTAGWQTAVSLSRPAVAEEPGINAPVWVWTVVLLALACGMAWGVWKRR